MTLILRGFLVSALAQNPMDSAKPIKTLPVAGEVFDFAGHTAFVIVPPRVDPDKKIPWVWYAPTLPNFPGPEEKWMFQQFLDAGIGVAGLDVGESYGSPEGVLLYSKFYEELTQHRRFSDKPSLLARSRGGLMLYNWAVEHADCVSCVAGIYPVCDLRSYPGLQNAAGAYGMTAQQLESSLPAHNPVDRLAPLAKARVPIFHIHGDIDQIVPLPDNSGEVARRHRALGGEMTLKIMPGQGHSYWPGFFECRELVDFIVAHSPVVRTQ